MTRLILIAAICASACARPAAGTLRYKAQEPVWKVNDATTLEKRPEEREYLRTLYHVDGFFVRRLTRAMDFAPSGRALDVNSLDEVPDSTWFTNRIGVRDLTTDELRKGPNEKDSPFNHLPVKITGAKVGGTAIGFVAEDATGAKFLLKFDLPDVPEMETAAHVIGHRIVWASGYNVPEDHIGYLKRSDITVDPEAKLKDSFGKKTALTADRVDRALSMVFKTEDGRYRVLLSRFVPGRPIGPYAREGTRKDDPNDLIVHERRRSIRGQVPIFSWIHHNDLQEDNTLDTYIPVKLPNGEKDKNRGHVVHYLIDFGKSVGVMNNSNNWKTVGFTYRIDFAASLATFLTLGTWKRPWDRIEQPPYRGVAIFEADNFDPRRWKPNSIYFPYEDVDKFDGFWGAKIAMRFTREHLAAIIEEAQFTDPGARTYMLDTLIKRQRIVGRYWFQKVSPLDRFTVTGDQSGMRLCFDDLEYLYGFESGTPRYRVAAYDYAGKQIQSQPLVETSGGQACITSLPVGADRDGYTIVRIAAQRGDSARPPVRVHVARIAGGKLAVVGLRRE
ncbi:MAG: hypothetical protein H0T46_34400 [Deltaproteobacteria bacterium]|nr:hypothetical protein [Deltaproteobacteria bacterium]